MIDPLGELFFLSDLVFDKSYESISDRYSIDLKVIGHIDDIVCRPFGKDTISLITQRIEASIDFERAHHD